MQPKLINCRLNDGHTSLALPISHTLAMPSLISDLSAIRWFLGLSIPPNSERHYNTRPWQTQIKNDEHLLAVSSVLTWEESWTQKFSRAPHTGPRRRGHINGFVDALKQMGLIYLKAAKCADSVIWCQISYFEVEKLEAAPWYLVLYSPYEKKQCVNNLRVS